MSSLSPSCLYYCSSFLCGFFVPIWMKPLSFLEPCHCPHWKHQGLLGIKTELFSLHSGLFLAEAPVRSPSLSSDPCLVWLYLPLLQELKRWNTPRPLHSGEFVFPSACSPQERPPHALGGLASNATCFSLSFLGSPLGGLTALFPGFLLYGTLTALPPFSHYVRYICEYVSLDSSEFFKDSACVLILFVSLALPGPWQMPHKCWWNGFCKNHHHFLFLFRMEGGNSEASKLQILKLMSLQTFHLNLDGEKIFKAVFVFPKPATCPSCD